MGYFLEGKKIGLRPLTKSDVPVWHAWFNDPLVTENMNKGFFASTETAQEEFLSQLAKSRSDLQLGIVLRSSKALVGTVGLHKIDWLHRRGDISIVVGDRSSWGKGLATEAVALVVRHAFLKLNLGKLTAGMWSTNKGSRRCFESNGFVLEGTRRAQFHCGGRYVDEWLLGLLREDWEKTRRGA